jgi:hypothetical protein
MMVKSLDLETKPEVVISLQQLKKKKTLKSATLCVQALF